MITNIELKAMLRSNGVKHWQIAEKLNMGESTLSRMFRRELPPETKQKIIDCMYELMDGSWNSLNIIPDFNLIKDKGGYDKAYSDVKIIKLCDGTIIENEMVYESDVEFINDEQITVWKLVYPQNVTAWKNKK